MVKYRHYNKECFVKPRPEIQNRFNEVKYECAGDPLTLKKVATVEGAWRSARSGFFARAFAYIGTFVGLFVVLAVLWTFGGHELISKPIAENFTAPYVRKSGINPEHWRFHEDYAIHLKIIEENGKIYDIVAFAFLLGIPFLIIALYHLFIVVPRRREYVRQGDREFLRNCARSMGLPEDLFEVRSK